jgi:hypothetical protein
VILSLALGGLLFAASVPRIGEPVVVERESSGPVIGLAADVSVTSSVQGDVVSLLGDVRVSEGAVVHGDVVAVGGSVQCDGVVTGRIVAVGTFGGSPRPGSGRTRLGLELLRAGGWLGVGWALVLFFPRTVRRCTQEVHRLGVRLLAVGVIALVVWLAVMLVAVVMTSSPIGAGLLLLGVGTLLVLKAFGLVGLALAVGIPLARRFPSALRGEVPAVAVVLTGLLVASSLGAAGALVWQVVSVVGIAVALSAALGSWRSRSSLRLAVD